MFNHKIDIVYMIVKNVRNYKKLKDIYYICTVMN